VRILGLDISTSVVGYAIVEADDMSLVKIGHIDLKKAPKCLYRKADIVVGNLREVCEGLGVERKSVWVEEPVIRFTPGMSSAQTISMLLKFNAMVSYGLWTGWDREIVHVTPGDARRTCGLLMTTKKKSGGKSQKEQVYDQLTAVGGLLEFLPWPMTKTNKPKPENYDRADAYVVAYHGAKESRK